MQFTSEQRLDGDVIEREFTLDQPSGEQIPGTLWTPATTAPVPLILMAHNNALPKNEPRLVARARDCASLGYGVATIDGPGCGSRPRSAEDEQARAELRRAMRAGEPTEEIFESFLAPMVQQAIPEWRATLSAVLALPGIGGPVGFSGWTAVGIHLAVNEPRIVAAGFFAGGYVPRAQREEARQLTIPLQVLLQWDDEGNPRQRALDLFDAFGSKEKTLHANMGGHTGTPEFQREDSRRFYDRHLK